MSTSQSNKKQEVINTDAALQMLVSVFPELREQWTRYIAAEYNDYASERLNYIDIGEIINFIINRKRNNDTGRFDDFFNQVETILVKGDSYTQELMVIGLLEGIQNVCGYDIDFCTGFNEWLKPETKKAWDQLIQFWQGDKPGHTTS